MSHQQIHFMNYGKQYNERDQRLHCSSCEILGNWLREVSDRIHEVPVPSYPKEQQIFQFLSKYLSFSGKRHGPTIKLTEKDEITS